MKIDREANIERHFDMVIALTERLGGHNLSLGMHSYNPLSFGHWKMVIGSEHKERKFLWDGRDFFLTVCDRIKINETQRGKWITVYELPIGQVSDEELFEKMYQMALEIK